MTSKTGLANVMYTIQPTSKKKPWVNQAMKS